MKKILTEIWKDIPGYEGLYQASNLGRIRSLDHISKGGHGALTQIRYGRLLKPRCKKGKYVDYYTVSLCLDGKPINYYVHRLVWITFNGDIPKNLVISHIDEDSSNNRLDNLMACTQRENVNWGTHNERLSKSLKERAKIINPITNIRKYAEHQIN